MKDTINIKASKRIRGFGRLTPARILVYGFILLIMAGTLLLSLPISTQSGKSTGFTDALFTSASCVCVTGLAVEDTNTYWSFFGKLVILLLIQIGALGIMSMVTLFTSIAGKNLGLSHRMALKESISNYSLENIVPMFWRIVKMMLIAEGIGAVLISAILIPKYGLAEGVGKSIFHSVSSFCNAGFDVFGTGTDKFASLTGFYGNFLMLLTTSALVIVGGMGFVVWEDLIKVRRFSRFRLNTKVVLFMTALLIIAGSIVFMAFEAEGTMKGLPLHTKLLNAFFQSVSTRTAGFNTITLGDMNPATSLFTVLLMFIGAAPGSTGGGIKITTFFVLVAAVASYLNDRDETQVFRRRVSGEIINKSVAVFLLSLVLVMVSTMVLLFNQEGTLMQALFETVSAFSTAGFSTGITPGLSDFSKYQLIITMLCGRAGILTIFAALSPMRRKDERNYRCPEEEITVG